jgi:putative Mn2+ efflux pump MntP
MKPLDPRAILIIGFALVLFGFVVPFLMVLGSITPSFALSFVSHAASVSGLFLGLIGAAWYIRLNKS